MREPRGVVVLDIGYTHSKAILFDDKLDIVDEREVPSGHKDDLYLALDMEPFLATVDETLTGFDKLLPVDRIVTSAHGSAIALLDANGDLALPIMDYAARPPEAIVGAYRAIAPEFSEVFAPVLPGALTLGLQLFWQEHVFPHAFSQVRAIMPTAQYTAWRLGGRMATEVTTLGAQSQLLNVLDGKFSSLAIARNWARLFAPRAKAFDILGHYNRRPLRGEAAILAGIHDSNANYLRYLATGSDTFTLLSTGTWIIGFTPGVDLSGIDPQRDVVSNTDYLGRPVASCRFMGGKEFESGADGADPKTASLETAVELIERGSMALPAFSDSGGPIANCGDRGRFVGEVPSNDGEKASLMSLYCAMMSWQSLTAVGGESEVIVDGPFAKNEVYLSTLAGLIEPRCVYASAMEQGTASGAALLGHCSNDGKLANFPVDLRRISPFRHGDLHAYADRWLGLAEGQSAQK